MRRALHASFGKTVVSFTAAACAFALIPKVCVAGDKIEFSAPSNPALLQKPEREIRTDDAAPAKLDFEGAGAAAAAMPEASAPQTVIISTDNNKRDKLRAWDDKMHPFGSDDSDDLSPTDKKAAANSFTNSYDSKPAWEPQRGMDRGSKQSEAFTGLAAAKPQNQFGGETQGQNSSDWLSEMNKSAGKEELSTRNFMDAERHGSATGGLSAWETRSWGSQKETYAERVDQYKQIYSQGSVIAKQMDTRKNDTANGNTTDGSSLTPAPILDTTQPTDTLTDPKNPQNDLSAFNSSANLPSYSSRYGATAAIPGVNPNQTQNQTRPAMTPWGGEAYRPAVSQPAILSFPKKPGSLFQ